MRLDKLLSETGHGSRREVREIIRKQRITVNGSIAGVPEMQVPEDAEIRMDGVLLEKPGPVYLMLHKPAGYLTAVSDRSRPVVMELVDEPVKDLAPAGRLDLDAEGLLLITNDGKLSHQLLAPKNRVPKKYYVETDRPIPEGAAEILTNPIEFQEFTSLPGIYVKISERSAFLTVFEGRFHEVKRMFHTAGCEVTYLRRVAFGPLELSDLPKGEYRRLTREETELLKQCVSNQHNGV